MGLTRIGNQGKTYLFPYFHPYNYRIKFKSLDHRKNGANAYTHIEANTKRSPIYVNMKIVEK